jgi:hypothetical protein
MRLIFFACATCSTHHVLLNLPTRITIRESTNHNVPFSYKFFKFYVSASLLSKNVFISSLSKHWKYVFVTHTEKRLLTPIKKYKQKYIFWYVSIFERWDFKISWLNWTLSFQFNLPLFPLRMGFSFVSVWAWNCHIFNGVVSQPYAGYFFERTNRIHKNSKNWASGLVFTMPLYL